MMHLSSTDLPVPEPPITTTDSATPMSRSMPSSTTFDPKLLRRLRMRIFGGSAIGSSVREEQLGDHVVRDQDHDRRRDHGIGGGGTHTLGTAARVVAVVAAHQRHDEAEHPGLDEAGYHVVPLEILDRRLDVVAGVEVELVDPDDVAAEHPDDVADQHQHRQAEGSGDQPRRDQRSEEHTSELQSLMRISYAVF